MNNLPVVSETSKRFVIGAHAIGTTVDSVIVDLARDGHVHLNKEDVVKILKDNGQFPKLTLGWWTVKATHGLDPTETPPWNAWSSRFIFKCKANNDTNNNIFANMRKRRFDIPGVYWIQVVLDKRLLIENEMARVRDTQDEAALQNIIVMAHSWGYTLSEITREIFRRNNGSTSAVNTDIVKMALESSGIPESYHRKGRKFGVVAREFVVSAYNLGMHVDNIRDRMYVHGFDLPDSKPILDLLKRNGIWQGEKLERARPSQAARHTQPKAGDDVRPGGDRSTSLSGLANAKPGGRISVSDLLN